MTWWRPRDPGTFPPAFHEAIRRGVGDHLIWTYRTELGLKAAKRDWNVFMYSLRQYTTHPTSRAAEGLMQRTKTVHDRTRGVWEFRLVTRRSVFADLARPNEVLGHND